MSDLGRKVLAAMEAPAIFGPHYSPAESGAPWRVVLKVLFGLVLTQAEMALFTAATGRTVAFKGPITEAWLLCGRRSGKSRMLALIAVVLATFQRYEDFLAPGERAVVAVLAAGRDQAATIFGYARALLLETPMLRTLVERETSDELVLSNRVVIGIYTSSYRSIRGRTLAAALCDEAAHWRADDSKNPAEAVIRALRPSLATIPGAPLLFASSVYAKSGTVYDAYARHWGRDTSSVLCWKSDTATMNPSFRQSIIDEAYANDAVDAATEYGSMFRTDVSAFLSDEDIDAAIVRDRRSLPMTTQYSYHAFVELARGVAHHRQTAHWDRVVDWNGVWRGRRRWDRFLFNRNRRTRAVSADRIRVRESPAGSSSMRCGSARRVRYPPCARNTRPGRDRGVDGVLRSRGYD